MITHNVLIWQIKTDSIQCFHSAVKTKTPAGHYGSGAINIIYQYLKNLSKRAALPIPYHTIPYQTRKHINIKLF